MSRKMGGRMVGDDRCRPTEPLRWEDGVLMIDDTHGSSGYARHRQGGEAKRTDRVDSVEFKAQIYTYKMRGGKTERREAPPCR